jgi:hypothetical protein
MEKAEEFINQEEMIRMYAERDAKPKEQVKKKEFSRGEGASSRGRSSKKGEKLPEKKKPVAERDYNFTPLNTTVAEIYTLVKSSLRPPKKMMPPQKNATCIGTVTITRIMATRRRIACLSAGKLKG